MKNVKVSFYVNGTIETEVSIPDDISIEDFEQGLNSGDYATSMEVGGNVINLIAGCKDIGKVEDVLDINCEYNDFTVEELAPIVDNSKT